MKFFKEITRTIWKFIQGNSRLFLWKDNSSQYWEDRYQNGGNSGYGSYGVLSEFKANFVNRFLYQNKIKSIIEFGCGDSNQLKLINYPEYIGIDVSYKSIELCKQNFRNDNTKRFYHLSETPDVICDLAISMEVIFHLIEDDNFNNHMNYLFSHSSKFVIIYSSNVNKKQSFLQPHIKHRRFSDWINLYCKNWELLSTTMNPFTKKFKGSFSNFYVYKNQDI